MFPPTQPMDVPDSRPPPAQAGRGGWLPSDSFADLDAPPRSAAHTALSSLSPSLMQDLMRFDADNPQREFLDKYQLCAP